MHRDPDCTLCPLHEGAKTVCLAGTGPRPAWLMIVGEAPGATEDEQGEPFVGRSGQLLNEALAHVGLKRSEVFITNTAKCRPPGNRTPTKDEVGICLSTYFDTEVDEVEPHVVMPLGNTALEGITGQRKITRWRGQRLSWAWDHVGPVVVPTFHPSGVLRNPRWKPLFLRDFEVAADALLELLD